MMDLCTAPTDDFFEITPDACGFLHRPAPEVEDEGVKFEPLPHPWHNRKVAHVAGCPWAWSFGYDENVSERRAGEIKLKLIESGYLIVHAGMVRPYTGVLVLVLEAFETQDLAIFSNLEPKPREDGKYHMRSPSGLLLRKSFKAVKLRVKDGDRFRWKITRIDEFGPDPIPMLLRVGYSVDVKDGFIIVTEAISDRYHPYHFLGPLGSINVLTARRWGVGEPT